MPKAVAFVLTHESQSNPLANKSLSLQALAITRSLGRRGIPVIRLHPNHLEIGLRSRYCSKVEICPNQYESEQDLVAFLLDLAKRYEGPRVLIPASDDAVYFLGRHRDSLLAEYKVPVPSKQTIEQIVDKRRQYEEAQACGIPIPETYFPASVNDVRSFANQLSDYPYVIKPNVAHRWRLSTVQKELSSAQRKSSKAVVIHSADELVAEYQFISRCDPDVMIQEIIGGEDELLYTFLGYFDENSRPLGYCVRSKIRQHPLNFGYCTLTVSCENATVVEQSIRLLQGLNFHGIVGVEWKHDPKTNRYKLIEINARAVNTSAIAQACGVDLPYIAFADSIGQSLEPVTSWQSGVKWIWFSQDIWAVRELLGSGQLSLRGWWRSLSGKRVHAVYAADDLRPFLEYAWRACVQLARASLRRLSNARRAKGVPAESTQL